MNEQDLMIRPQFQEKTEAPQIIQFINADGIAEAITLDTFRMGQYDIDEPTKRLSGKEIPQLNKKRKSQVQKNSHQESASNIKKNARIFEDFTISNIKQEWIESINANQLKIEDIGRRRSPILTHQNVNYLLQDHASLDQLHRSLRKRSFELTEYNQFKDQRHVQVKHEHREEYLAKRREPEGGEEEVSDDDAQEEGIEEEEMEVKCQESEDLEDGEIDHEADEIDPEDDEDYQVGYDTGNKTSGKKRAQKAKKSSKKQLSRESSISQGRSRGTYNMLSLYKRVEITNYAAKYGIDAAHKRFKLCKSRIKRYQRNGPDRKKGGGRKTLDPDMEVYLLDWIQQSTRESRAFPSRIIIKEKAKEISKVSDFLASKGWCDKFFKRNCANLDQIKRLYVKP